MKIYRKRELIPSKITGKKIAIEVPDIQSKQDIKYVLAGSELRSLRRWLRKQCAPKGSMISDSRQYMESTIYQIIAEIDRRIEKEVGRDE